MAITQDILATPHSGYNYIDSLLAAGPDWNYLTGNGTSFRTILYYSFDTSGSQYENGVQAFNAAQQQAVREILAYTSQVTGISFAESASASMADLHFATAAIASQDLGGVCYAPYQYYANNNNQLTSYTSDAFIYLDAVRTADPAPVAGSWWYQAMLHEVGHALGLKHPFAATADNPSVLSAPYQDDTGHTLMSYTQAGEYASQFASYDLAALNYLYGGDGLRGNLGVGTNGLYLTGSTLSELVTLPHGNVVLDDTGGVDAILYDSQQGAYSISLTADKQWLHIQGDQIDHLVSNNLEYICFSDSTLVVDTLLQLQGTTVLGTVENDLLVGSVGSDLLAGLAGNDTITVNGGNDLVFGGDGLDTVRFMDFMDSAVITHENENWTVSGRSGISQLSGVERVQFNNGKVALDLDINQEAGQAALLTASLAGKEAVSDPGAVGWVLGLLSSRSGDMDQLCSDLVSAGWFKSITGGTDAGLATLLSNNLSGQDFNSYLGLLEGHGGDMSQSELLMYVALSPENQANIDLVGLQQSGLVYV